MNILAPELRRPTAEPVAAGERVGRCRITKKARQGPETILTSLTEKDVGMEAERKSLLEARRTERHAVWCATWNRLKCTCGGTVCVECGRDLHGYKPPLCRYCAGTAE